MSGPDAEFRGFPRGVLDFYRGLAAHNDKEWFEDHRAEYEERVLQPARDFVTAYGEKLRTIVPAVQADPRINRSLFKIFRDVRFSRDKSPFKTHLALWFWEGVGPRMECPGFYVHIEPDYLLIGAGIYKFTRDALEAYRRAVDDEGRGSALAAVVRDLETAGYAVGGRNYKRTPRGFASDHPRADLLRRDGLYAGLSFYPPPDDLFGPESIDLCFNHHRRMLGLHRWLAETAGPSGLS